VKTNLIIFKGVFCEISTYTVTGSLHRLHESGIRKALLGPWLNFIWSVFFAIYFHSLFNYKHSILNISFKLYSFLGWYIGCHHYVLNWHFKMWLSWCVNNSNSLYQQSHQCPSSIKLWVLLLPVVRYINIQNILMWCSLLLTCGRLETFYRLSSFLNYWSGLQLKQNPKH
jgi:hypothetical protein